MKNGTVYAARLKRVYGKFRQTVPTPDIPGQDDPLRRLGIGVLGVECGDARGQVAADKLASSMVDWNEVRVSTAGEVHRAIGHTIPNGLQRCQQLIRALHSVYQHENRLSLDRLKSIGRREARHYLEQLDGVDAYAVASVVLWSFGGHAIPVDDTLLEALRQADLVHQTTDRGDVQAFLERHVASADAMDFCLAMRSFPEYARSTAKSTKKRTPAKAKKKKGA